MDEPGKELVPVESHEGIVAHLPLDPTRAANDVWATYDCEDPKGRMQIVRCLQGADKKGTESYGKEVKIEHVVCSPVQLVDEKSGEVVDAIRTVLVEPSGTRHAFVSVGVFRSLGNLSFLWGPPPWKGGRLVNVVLSRTRKGGNWLTLEPVR